jgi:hypothetical protein
LANSKFARRIYTTFKDEDQEPPFEPEDLLSAHAQPTTHIIAPILGQNSLVVALTDISGISADTHFAQDAPKPFSALGARLHKLLRSKSDAGFSDLPVK